MKLKIDFSLNKNKKNQLKEIFPKDFYDPKEIKFSDEWEEEEKNSWEEEFEYSDDFDFFKSNLIL